MERTFKTALIWHDSRGTECTADVRVTYVGRKGYAATLEQPGEDASIEIIKIVDSYGDGVPDRFLEDGDLMVECFEDWRDDELAALEYRAEQMREDRLMEKF